VKRIASASNNVLALAFNPKTSLYTHIWYIIVGLNSWFDSERRYAGSTTPRFYHDDSSRHRRFPSSANDWPPVSRTEPGATLIRGIAPVDHRRAIICFYWGNWRRPAESDHFRPRSAAVRRGSRAPVANNALQNNLKVRFS